MSRREWAWEPLLRARPVSHESPGAAGRDGGRRPQSFCGPAALSIISGRPAELCAAWVNHRRGRSLNDPVRGMSQFELERVALSLGFRLEPVIESFRAAAGVEQPAVECVLAWKYGEWKRRARTLASVRRFMELGIGSRIVHVLMTPGHFLVAWRGRLYDNAHPLGAPWRRFRVHLRSMVVAVCRVEISFAPEERDKRRRDRFPPGWSAAANQTQTCVSPVSSVRMEEP